MIIVLVTAIACGGNRRTSTQEVGIGLRRARARMSARPALGLEYHTACRSVRTAPAQARNAGLRQTAAATPPACCPDSNCAAAWASSPCSRCRTSHSGGRRSVTTPPRPGHRNHCHKCCSPRGPHARIGRHSPSTTVRPADGCRPSSRPRITTSWTLSAVSTKPRTPTSMEYQTGSPATLMYRLSSDE